MANHPKKEPQSNALPRTTLRYLAAPGLDREQDYDSLDMCLDGGGYYVQLGTVRSMKPGRAHDAVAGLAKGISLPATVSGKLSDNGTDGTENS